MWQFLWILLLFAAAIVAIKAAVLLLFLAGLIFRTKETVALIAVLGALALIRNYTVACVFIGVVLAVVGCLQHRRTT